MISVHTKTGNDETQSLFETYDADDETDYKATIKYHRKLFYQKDSEDPMKELYLYNIENPNTGKLGYVVPKVYYEEEPRKHLPKWIRQEIKKDKRSWKQIHQTLKQTPKYSPEYFSPLPEVEKAVVNYEKYEKYLHPHRNNDKDNLQNNEQDSYLQNIQKSSRSHNFEENSDLHHSQKSSRSQSFEANSNLHNSQKNSSSQSFEGNLSLGSSQKNSSSHSIKKNSDLQSSIKISSSQSFEEFSD